MITDLQNAEIDSRGVAASGRGSSVACRGVRASLAMTTASSPASDASLYEALGVPRDASQADIRRAYRRRALQYHPDKNPDDADAAQNFHRVSVAYHVLGDARSRARYDRGEGAGASELYQGFDFSRDLFNKTFGEALMREWRPGLLVSGLLVASGKRLSITIHPDGSMDEREHPERHVDRVYSYTRMTITKGQHRTHCMSFATRFGQALAELVVPSALVAQRPLLGHLAVAVVSWVPTAAVLVASLALAHRRRRTPGDLPDSLAAALRQANWAGVGPVFEAAPPKG